MVAGQYDLGGVPAGCPTLIRVAAGSGKTLFGITFLVHGAVHFSRSINLAYNIRRARMARRQDSAEVTPETAGFATISATQSSPQQQELTGHAGAQPWPLRYGRFQGQPARLGSGVGSPAQCEN